MLYTTKKLEEQKLIQPPKFLTSNIHYETIMGSMAYGTSADDSDIDMYGFCIPPKNDVFVHLAGEIRGFGKQKQRFEQYQEHHIQQIRIKENTQGKRKELIERFGYDVKYATHTVRLLDEIEQILTEGDLDMERNVEQLKSIRRGEWKEQEVFDYFTRKERDLETLYTNSKLRYSPDEPKVKELLLNCLEHHYGSLDECVVRQDSLKLALEQIHEVCEQTLGQNK